MMSQMSKRSLYVIDDNENFLSSFKDREDYFEKNGIALFAMRDLSAFYAKLKVDKNEEKLFILDFFLGDAGVSEVIEDIRALIGEEQFKKSCRIWLCTGMQDAAVEEVIQHFGIESTWYRKPMDIDDFCATQLGLAVSRLRINPQWKTLITQDDLRVRGRFIDARGRVVKGFGILPQTAEGPLRQKVFERVKQERSFAEDFFIPNSSESKGMEYIETVNLYVPPTEENDEHLWQLFLPKEEPAYDFEDPEKRFTAFAKKLLQSLLYFDFTRARLYMLKTAYCHDIEDEKITERTVRRYYARAMMGHTPEEEKRFLGQNHPLTSYEEDILQELEKKKAQSPEALVYQIASMQEDKDSPWAGVFDTQGYDDYLVLPVFDKDRIIMVIKCDRYRYRTDKHVASDHKQEIKEEEIKKYEKALIHTLKLLKCDYSFKRRTFYNEIRNQLFEKLQPVSPDTEEDEKDILAQIVEKLYETVEDLDKKRAHNNKAEALWMMGFDENTGNLLPVALRGNVPEFLKEVNAHNYNVLKMFLQHVSKKDNRLYIADLKHSNWWYEKLENNDKISSDYKQWYRKNLGSVYLWAVYVNDRLKAVLILYSTSPYYLSRPIEDLVHIALQKCRLTLEVHAKNKERLFLSREMVHDLKSPLLHLQNTLYEVGQKDKKLATRQAVFLQALQRSVSDILMLSKLDRNALELKETNVDFGKFLQELEASFRPVAQDSGNAFALQTEPKIPTCLKTDPTLLRHILDNLLSNAFKFTHGGQVTLKVGYDQSGKNLEIAVEDTGEGIEEEKIVELFELFKLGRSEFASTGIGLYIVRHLTERLGGQIEVKSQKDNGSRFLFSLPLERRVCGQGRLENLQHRAGWDMQTIEKVRKTMLKKCKEDIVNAAKEAYRSGHGPTYEKFLEVVERCHENTTYSRWIKEAIASYDFRLLDNEMQRLKGGGDE